MNTTKAPPATQTAYGPMVIVAVEQTFAPSQRLLSDDLAVDMLPATLRGVVAACRWGVVRRWLIAASEKKAPGIWAAMGGRKRYLDERVEEAVDRGAKAVVVLGAGLDTRGARLASRSPHIPVYELDLPANVARKQARLLARFGELPRGLTLAPVDFESVELDVALERHGFDMLQPAIFVWEGVTQYLTEAGFHRTMAFLSRAAPGSALAFTYIRADFIAGDSLYGSAYLRDDLVVRRGVWRFGLAPPSVGSVLESYGWREREQVGAAEFTQRYVEPTGRPLPVSEIERCVYAVRP